MARATRAGGASYTAEELADPSPPQRPRRAEIGFVDRRTAEVKPSVETDGGDSTQFSENEVTPNDKPKASRRRRVPTTESHSNQQEAAVGSDAHSTDTDGQSNPSRQSARVRSTGEDDFDEFG